MSESSKKILVVDDEQNLRLSLAQQLGDLGYMVSTAENSKQALGLLESSPFHLVILDLKFPEGMKGHEMLKLIKNKYPSTKVLVLTAYANLMEGKTAKLEGADEFLSKPYNVEDMLQVVSDLLT